MAVNQTYEVEYELPTESGTEERVTVVIAKTASEAESKLKAKFPKAVHIYAELYP